MLNIRLTQREPVVRFQKGGYGFYAHCNGFIFPLQENYTSPVPVMDGAVPIKATEGYKGAPGTEEEKAWIAGVISLVQYMEKIAKEELGYISDGERIFINVAGE